MSSLGPWETILSCFALEAERIVIFDWSKCSFGCLGSWDVPEQLPKARRWFGWIFKIPIKNRDSPFGVIQVMNTLTKNHLFVYPMDAPRSLILKRMIWSDSRTIFRVWHFFLVFMGNCKEADPLMLRIFHEGVDSFTTQIYGGDLKFRRPCPQITVPQTL